MAGILVVGTPEWCEQVTEALREAGHAVRSSHDAVDAMQQSLRSTPRALVTQSTLMGASGLQLCRLLQAELPLAGIPVVVMNEVAQVGGAYQARAAGAAAYVHDVAGLLGVLTKLLARPQLSVPERIVDRTTVENRLSLVLDRALRDGEIAADVRALATVGGLEQLFCGLVDLVADVMPYAWLGLVTRGEKDLFLLHAAEDEPGAAEQEARAVLGLDDEMPCLRPRAAASRATTRRESAAEPFEVPIFFGDSVVGQLAITIPKANERDVKRTVGRVAYELGGPLKIISLLEQVQRQAATDTLTGLMNRRAVLELANRERDRAARHGKSTAFLVVDVDHFKRVNDVHGHPAGDAVLRGIAQSLCRATRSTDIAGRWGGEEFVIVLPETEPAQALAVAERVRSEIEHTSQLLPSGGSLVVTVSIGVSIGAGDWKIDDCLTAADEALYAAKRAGRNRVVGPDVEMPVQLKRAS